MEVAELNKIASDYQPLINAVNVAWGLGGAVLVLVIIFAKKVLQFIRSFFVKKQTKKLSPEERKIFGEVYKMISDAKNLVFTQGVVRDEAHGLFWKARDRARLELPEDVQEYAQALFDKMHRAYILIHNDLASSDKGGYPAQSDERKRSSKEHSDLIGQIIKEQPHEVFAPYMRVKVE